MRKRISIFAVVGCMIIILAAGGVFAWYYCRTTDVSKEFTESRQNIVNPARGFYYQLDSSEKEIPEEIEENNIRLVLLTFDLQEEKGKEVSDEKITELEESLSMLSEAGLKVIFRAAYGFGSEYAYEDPENIETIVGHIRQIAAVLNKYKGTVLTVQAGMLGPYGEWHHSNHMEAEEEGRESRNRIIAKWLEELEGTVTVDIRRPRFIRDAVEAGIEGTRLGIHNDALLAGDDDMGTYDAEGFTRQQELEWMGENIRFGFNGGEMPCISEYTNPNNVLSEFSKMHVSYLNSTYNEEVLEQWKNLEIDGENAYNVIERKLGYRFGMKECKINDGLRAFHSIKFDAVLENTGFAPIVSGYQLYIVAEAGNEKFLYQPKDVSLSNMLAGEIAKVDIEIPVTELIDKENDFKENIRLGILISDSKVPLEEGEGVRLANDEIEWEDHINYFGQYKYDNGVYRWEYAGEQAAKISADLRADLQTNMVDEKNDNTVVSDKMSMVIFKIGKADAILIDSNGSTLLIDTGEDEDAAEILEYLNKEGIQKIDTLIFSHFDKDHVGGADKLIENIEVSKVYQPAYEEDSGQFEEYKDSVEANGIEVFSLGGGSEEQNIQCGELEVKIYPAVEETYKDKNDYSLAVSILHGDNRFLFTGDAEEERLKEMLKGDTGLDLQHDFLKIPHHGRIEDNSASFLDAVVPKYAVITCSDKNPPDEELLDLLEEKKISSYLTSNGNIYVESDGETITVRQ